jgi:hypothetical protein
MSRGLQMSPTAVRLSRGISQRENGHTTNTALSSAQGEKVCKVSTKGIIMQSPYSLRSTFILRWPSGSRLGPP